MTADRQATSAERLDEHLSLYPHLTDRILRQMLVELHARDLVNIDEIYDEARAAGGYVESLPPSERGNPNVAEAPFASRWRAAVPGSVATIFTFNAVCTHGNILFA